MRQFYEQGGSNTSQRGTHGVSFRKTPAKSSSLIFVRGNTRATSNALAPPAQKSDVSSVFPYDAFPKNFFLSFGSNNFGTTFMHIKTKTRRNLYFLYNSFIFSKNLVT